jgi:hypothetical protein
LKPFAWFQNCNREQLSWRTWQRCLLEGWIEFSGRWPRSGMMLNGIAYRLPTLVPRIDETDCLLLPTVVASEWRGSASRRFLGSPLFRGSKMSEGLRTCQSDAIYTHPNFAEAAMGFPLGWTDLEGLETQ